MTVRQAFLGAYAPISLRFLASVALVALISGCQAVNGVGTATRAESATGSVPLLDQDIEAPDVFETTDDALWDGRPSLGGVWVAAPDVLNPERVVMRNPANGQVVVGALFKKQHGNPGPNLQLSSEAAVALGILAGAPTEIEVVALRRQEAPDVAEPDGDVAAEPDAPAETDAIAVAAAAVEELDPSEVQDAGADADALPTIAPAEMPDRRPGLFGRLVGGLPSLPSFGRGDAPAAAPLPLPEALSETPVADGAAPSAVEQSSLDAAPAAATGRQFVQVATFDSRERADAAGARVTAAGLTPRVLSQKTSSGREMWRIVIGPLSGGDQGKAVIRKADELGFGDAFVISG